MLVANIDDSGNNREGPVFVLAGYVADVNQWKRFADQWQMVLDMSPKMKVIKVQEALRGEALWARLGEKERNNRLKRLASIVHKHVCFGVVVSLAWDDIRLLETEFPDHNQSPYVMLFHHLMARVTSWIWEHEPGQKINFVFDEQGKLGEIATRTFVEMPPDIAPELQQLVGGPPLHRSDEKVLPLQAAHTIAWLVRRHAHDNNLTRDLTSWNPFNHAYKNYGISICSLRGEITNNYPEDSKEYQTKSSPLTKEGLHSLPMKDKFPFVIRWHA